MTQMWNIDVSKVGARLQAVRGHRTLEFFAETLGIHKNTLRNYELGNRTPDIGFIMNVCATCSILPEWLLFGVRQQTFAEREEAEGRMVQFAAPQAMEEKYVLVPRFDPPFTLENGRLCRKDRQEQQVAFRRNWIQATMGLVLDGLAAITVEGDAMDPTLRAGDLVLLDQLRREPVADAIYACLYNDNLAVKRLQGTPGGGIIIRNDNDRYEPIRLQAPERDLLTVVGQIVWMGRKL
jgi:phage repressor protein C with HTH and peptisase S24 domain